jgi:chromosome segregation ATPase
MIPFALYDPWERGQLFASGVVTNKMAGRSDPSKAQQGRFDLDRLERVIAQLVSAQHRLRGENESLRQELVERHQTVQGLDQEIAQLKQRRVDAMKRLDDLVSQVDDFEAFAALAVG